MVECEVKKVWFNMKLNTVETHHQKKYDDFLPTLSSVFLKARFFGISGFGLSVPFGWSLTLFLMLLILDSFAFWRVVRLLGGLSKNADGGGIIGRLSGSIFYANAVLSLLLSCKFVHSWRNLSSYWLSMETSTGLNFSPDIRIKKRTIFVVSFVAIFALVEHIMSMMAATGFDFPPEEYFHRYIMASHGFLLRPQDYNLWVAVPIFLLSKLATVLWNFQDLIIILISMGLTSRYHRLNLYISQVVTIEKRLKGKQRFGTELYLQIQVWRRLRDAYVRQATLVRMVDRKLGPLVLLSNVNNFYFICLQLFFGIHDDSEDSLIGRCYHIFSLSWLLVRACCVVLAASDVHLHSKQALKCLHSCPSAAYNIEIKRLQCQLTNDVVVLTGMGFFSLKRELLLKVAAAILKYELVLIQYDT